MEYNWCEYYRKAYEKEKKANTLLAGETADAEAKREELQAKYESICANPLYKVSKIPSFLKRGIRKVARGLTARERTEGVNGAQAAELSAAYAERLESQRDSYGQWIAQEEESLWERCLGDLAREEKTERRCLVISYGELAGIKDLRKITGENAGEDILLFAEHAEELDKRALTYIEEFFCAYPGTKLLCGAEDKRTEEKRSFPWFKPCFSPDTLLGFFYFGSYFAVDRVWAEKTILAGYPDERRNLYDYVLRLLKPYFRRAGAVNFEKNRPWRSGAVYDAVEGRREGEILPEILCTDLVLYHRNNASLEEAAPDREYYLHTGEMRKDTHPEFWGFEKEFVKLKQDFIKEIGFESVSYQTLHPDVWTVAVKEEGNALLSVIIPSKDHPELVEKCIGSFLERTDLPGLRERVEFIVVDNGSTAENREKIRSLLEKEEAACLYLYEPMEFNFSAMCNLGVSRAKGEYILLLNDDIEIIEKNWLRLMLGQACLSGTGAVGAKLWYPEEEKMQHAGVTNMHVGPSHKMTTFPDDRVYYYGHNTVSYDMIAVTAACLLVRKTVYEEAGGLDESMAVAYNDVDFCFTLAERGYRNVLRNDAVLLHHESASRGIDGESDEKWRRLLGEKAKLYKKHPLFLGYDPYYSEELAGYALDYRIGYRFPYERPFPAASCERFEGKKELEKSCSDGVMLTLEQLENRRKLYLEEPDILEAEGWCYMLGQDNCLFERWFILEAENGDHYYRFPVKERRRPDVEAILPLQTNIELSGFTCKILKDDLKKGKYSAGMLYRNLCTGKTAYKRAGREMEI